MLTFFCALLFHISEAHANSNTSQYDNSNSEINTAPGKDIGSPFANSDTHERVGVLVKYMRDNAASMLPGLPSSMRDPAGWLTNNLHAMEDELGLIGGGHDNDNASVHEGNSLLQSIFQPVQSLMQSPDPRAAEALWMTPNYHHKGFLPFHDAMILGFGVRESAFDNKINMEFRPYYAQNWVSQRSYYGAEFAIGIGPQLGLKELGKIAIRYIGGDSDLMDHGHGFDMHTEMRFNDNLSLHAGVREDYNSDLGNYVMLRWQMANLH